MKGLPYQSAEPLVTVLTPVYNGEGYLAECIESVLKQDYRHWEYIIVNNCSTDRTLEIASSYASRDPRIRIVTNPSFVGVIENHNIAFGLIPIDSKYCKVVSADDWLAPECLSSLVRVAEAFPSVGIVGSYQKSGDEIKWRGLSDHVEFLSGRQVVRLCSLKNLAVFGNPTSVLYRSRMVRDNAPFFPHSQPYADISACYQSMRNHDFGFVHEVLSTERIHERRVSRGLEKTNVVNSAILEMFLQYGPAFLTPEEFAQEKAKKIDDFHRWLGGCLLKLSGVDFWKYQTGRLRDLGYPVKWPSVLRGALAEMIEELRNPRSAYRKMLSAVTRALSRLGI